MLWFVCVCVWHKDSLCKCCELCACHMHGADMLKCIYQCMVRGCSMESMCGNIFMDINYVDGLQIWHGIETFFNLSSDIYWMAYSYKKERWPRKK